MGRRLSVILVVLVCVTLLPSVFAQMPKHDTTAIPQPLVDSYSSLADVILGAKKTEWNLVHSILATTYGHAEGVHAKAQAKLTAGQGARNEIENLAMLVAQLGNEGDAAVAAVRKRLIDGGHHHHADDTDAGKFDEGFVIIDRATKKALLDAAKAIGGLAGGKDAAALAAQWKIVQSKFGSLHSGVNH